MLSVEQRPNVALLYPRGHYRQHTYYFRGGSPQKEPEYLRERWADEFSRIERAKQDRNALQGEYNRLENELVRRYELAESITPGSPEERRMAQLDHERAKSTAETDQLGVLEGQLEQARLHQGAAYMHALEKEKVMLTTDIRALKLELEVGKEALLERKREVVRLVRSKEYARALHNEAKLGALLALNQRMKAERRQLFGDENENTRIKQQQARPDWEGAISGRVKRAGAERARGVKALMRAVDELRGTLKERQKLTQEDAELMDQVFFSRAISRRVLLRMIGQLELLGEAYASVGGTPDDCSHLREQVAELDAQLKAECGNLAGADEEEEEVELENEGEEEGPEDEGA